MLSTIPPVIFHASELVYSTIGSATWPPQQLQLESLSVAVCYSLQSLALQSLRFSELTRYGDSYSKRYPYSQVSRPPAAK